MRDETSTKKKFIENQLPKLITKQQKFQGYEVVKCSAEPKSHLDGFMSSIFTVQLTTKTEDCW